MLTVEEREQLRRAYHVEHKSVRQIAREFQVARQTVRKALASAAPATYTLQAPRPAPKLGPYQAHIADLLAENARLPRKQRYTSHKIFEVLHAQGYTGSEARVRGYIAQFRQSTQRPAVYLPLEFDPGTDAQVDWGEAQAIIAGVQQTVQFFVMRLCYSRRVFAMAFPSQKQECFFAAHVAAFAHFGGVPQRLTYDNLTTAVKRVFTGRTRQEQHTFVAFRSHYLFDSHFCTPGQGHEKGGVEHGIGFVRRNFLVPLPIAESFADVNAQILAACIRDDGRTVHGHTHSIADAWAEERPFLRALPAYSFDCGVNIPARLTPYSQVIFETNRYSVPVERARRDVVLKAYAFHIDILDKHEVLARHPRCYDRNQDIFDPLHCTAEPVILVGNPGLGKTHIATGLALAACRQGQRVRFYTAAGLVNELTQAQDEHRVQRVINQALRCQLVVIDELGFIPFSEVGGQLMFQFCSALHERVALLVTTNLRFADWIQVFGNERMTAALLDRLTHRAHILEFVGESFRFRQRLQRAHGSAK